MQRYRTGSFPDMFPIVLERHRDLDRNKYLLDRYSLTRSILKLNPMHLEDLP
jgi:hypothetical protein